ncbi:hypothetical protein PUNSTDRAFT_140436 [Punctularia strigosozonata HHB-11173 SS5]|uniref:uncharacterized protein n=1 Tax=Punctularia strigosozonata (strain HHB-11173) TaxID=741275 RepID=UPI00044181BA|nr:uncharacterized protein PUNSTDRAFT_140436 [Punctularia strigosozonata HHB-11173 SS5]EIN14046.1 hypothetical protein PUNSTDRAFT_140436 [Punctularia strigosozonata HHB-11173 SS5]
MTAKTHQPSSKFYVEDVVHRNGAPQDYGIITRSWSNEEELPLEGEDSDDPFLRPLQNGEVGVTWAHPSGRDIVHESELVLVDRAFGPGDLCKRNIDDIPSGIITNVDCRVLLCHAVDETPIEGWKTMEELEDPQDVELGDFVVHADWIGQIVEMFDEAIVQVEGSRRLVRVPELSAHLMVGDKGKDILPEPAFMLPMFGLHTPMPRPAETDTVLDVKHTVLAVSWLAINQSLDPLHAAQKPRPPRFWYGNTLSQLTLVRLRSDCTPRRGDRVHLKDSSLVPITKHGEGDPNGPIEVNTLMVQDIRTNVDVLWQDGSSQRNVPSTSLVPYLNPSDTDAWPGDYVLWKCEGHSRPAVVQSVNAVDRTCIVRYMDDHTQDLASLLELDAYGIDDPSGPMSSSHEGLGLSRGDLVLIHREGTTNGAGSFRVPKIGEVEDWAREPPELDEDGQLVGWRAEMYGIGVSLAKQGGAAVHRDGQVTSSKCYDGSLNWLGEVMDLRLDGSVEVGLPDRTAAVFPLERLTKLYDGMDQLDDMFDDGLSIHSSEDDGNDIQVMDSNGQWADVNEDEDGWEDEMDVDSIEDKETSSIPEPAAAPTFSKRDSEQEPIETPSDKTRSEQSQLTTPDDDITNWTRFALLPSAPADHAFYTTTPGQPSRHFLSRLAKEYRVLSSSLPDTILVRAYEDRTDLLRTLIIGPENTPYEDAPFVIDWMLESDFPQSPPKAHFLSWTHGNGRVNPNLYEEGKVCLSILGTWSGDKTETWSPARSSLLQALVSIQGLVLVKEPWFCEPAYEKLRGTEEGSVSSRLYSEKAYVLSRGFVRRALELPPTGLETEINWLYRKKGKLEKVIQDARTLVDKSKSSIPPTEKENDRAVARLTEGGIIALNRVLVKLVAQADQPRSI